MGGDTGIKIWLYDSRISPELRDESLDVRRCRSTWEGDEDNFKIFRNYTRAGCRFECSLSIAR